MKIFIISHFYPPEIGAPQVRLSEMAREWSQKGHDVTVLTAFPNHPMGIIQEEYRGRIFQREILNGIKVWRHWLFVNESNGFIAKVISHISFMISVVFLSLFRGPRPDVIVVSSPTFFSVISAWIFSKVRRVPYVFEVRDLWPGIFIELGVLKNKQLIWILERIEMFLYNHAKKIVVVTKGFKNILIKRGIEANKIEVITNGVDLGYFNRNIAESDLTDFREKHGFGSDDFIVLYIGAHGISQALETVIHSAKKLHTLSKIKFVFVGEGAQKMMLQELVRQDNLSNVFFFPGCSRENVLLYYKMSNICLISLKDIAGFDTFIPSKMFEIMASKRAFIALVRGESAAILNASGGGAVIAPEDSNALEATVRELSQNSELLLKYEQNSFQFVAKYYDRNVLSENYLLLFKGLIH